MFNPQYSMLNFQLILPHHFGIIDVSYLDTDVLFTTTATS